MKYLMPVVVGFLIMVLNIVAPLLVLLALPFARWDAKPTEGYIRGDLPSWAYWISTPDERLPGDLGISEHRSLFEKYGMWFASWYWLGIRNPLFGLSFIFGKIAVDYMPEMVSMTGLWERAEDGIWQYGARIGSFKFACGYKVYKLPIGSFWAVPCFTVMHRPI
jgi:hypothetical protein